MPVYMKYEGIDGDATHQGHEKWIECTSFQWGTGRSIMTPVGRAANRESSAPSISEVTITKAGDLASIKLFQEAVTGGGGKKVQFHFVTTNDPGETYMEYELTDTMVASYSLSSGGDTPTESLSLNFTKIMYKYNTRDAAGKLSPATASYDLATAKKS